MFAATACTDNSRKRSGSTFAKHTGHVVESRRQTDVTLIPLFPSGKIRTRRAEERSTVVYVHAESGRPCSLLRLPRGGEGSDHWLWRKKSTRALLPKSVLLRKSKIWSQICLNRYILLETLSLFSQTRALPNQLNITRESRNTTARGKGHPKIEASPIVGF